MSNFTHAVGVICAGVLAFAGVAAASLLSPASGPAEEPGLRGPTGVITAGPTLIGRWQAPKPANQNAYVEFTEYGIWFASDGCNTLDGTWSHGAGEALRVRSKDVMTAIGCDNLPIPTVIASAQSVSFEEHGDRARFTAADGTKTELMRTHDTSVTLEGRWVSDNPASTGHAYLDFKADGTWRGSDGCNSALGSWELTANPNFDPTAMAEFSMESMAPGLLTIGGYSGSTDIGCETADPQLPLALEATTWFGFTNADKIWLVGDSTLQRADYPPTTLIRDTVS
ncbi:hypothetical protein G7067_11870 [Leucobacter insecticola]|uniref:META domain-containing protein n=1 Tax=Leucobacter insecticola TaxID=2714934 RepID=A0A6G8FKD8_9MICO|nr:hypothetical protein [Leucobacter insecticola]QIM16940.1 hypothetical protein G7067_11870 [Leucobacter insecticola]